MAGIKEEPKEPRQDTANRYVRILLDVIMGHGVKQIIISPGSRNTPVIIGAAARDGLEKHVVTDERTAAFMALGMALVSKEPVALCCTSGTALYNYAPAIAEAFYQCVPLIVITADRPAQWIDQDDSQTLRQSGALSHVVKAECDIPSFSFSTSKCANPEFGSEVDWFVNRKINEMMICALDGKKGPVHINIQLDNPLGAMVSKRSTKSDAARIIKTEDSSKMLAPELVKELAKKMAYKRVMVVAGFMQPDARTQKAVKAFCNLYNVTAMAELCSNLNLEAQYYVIDNVLCRQDVKDDASLRPDIVISIGGALVSRMLKEYLRGIDGLEHWSLADSSPGIDCFQHKSLAIDCDPATFFTAITSYIHKNELPFCRAKNYNESYNFAWFCARSKSKSEILTPVRSRKQLTDLEAFKILDSGLNRSLNVFLSNGTPIRYAQLTLNSKVHAYYGCRGVSGIEGTSATALGCAMAYGDTTLLITGDMSFAYNPQILGIGKGSRLNIIVINNGGGGIFRFIRTTRELPMREEYFCAAPQLPLEGLAHAYGWDYWRVETGTQLRRAICAMQTRTNMLLEIVTDPDRSPEALISLLSPHTNRTENE